GYRQVLHSLCLDESFVCGPPWLCSGLPRASVSLHLGPEFVGDPQPYKQCDVACAKIETPFPLPRLREASPPRDARGFARRGGSRVRTYCIAVGRASPRNALARRAVPTAVQAPLLVLRVVPERQGPTQ